MEWALKALYGTRVSPHLSPLSSSSSFFPFSTSPLSPPSMEADMEQQSGLRVADSEMKWLWLFWLYPSASPWPVVYV